MARSFKVDNWGTLLLQRIQQLYERGEHCDIMLKFQTGEEIPVHRMVLHACCSFFAVLEGTEALENSTLHLPPELTREALEPVIRFIYTGQLDISDGSVPVLVSTAQLLDMPLLEQLLQTHAVATSSPSTAPAPKPKVNRAPVRASYSPGNQKILRTPNKQELLPAGPSRIDLEVGDSACEFGSLPKLSELLMDTPSTPMNPPLLPLVRKANNSPAVNRDLKKAEKTFDELKKSSTPTSAVRRPAPSDSSKASEAKRMREEDIESFKELLAEQKRRTELAAEQGDETTTYDAAVDVGLDDWEEEDEEEEMDNEGLKNDSAKAQLQKSILKTDPTSPAPGEMKRVHFMESESLNSTSVEAAAVADEHIENNQQEDHQAVEVSVSESASATPDKDSSTITIFNENSEVLLREVVNSNSMTSQIQGKMIAEVLKRFPNLVSSGRNCKLKIVQRTPWWAKARVNFVLLKPTTNDEEQVHSPSSLGSKPSILRQHNAVGGRKSNSSSLGSSGAIAVNKRVSPFDNVTGPWICYDCVQTTDDGQNAALRLKTYYEYRNHLIQNHGYKADSQACEFCGHRAVKRNHMLFHLFTVHGVPPPAHTKFPQCEECDYVALTSSIMRKHMQKHQEGSENQCRVCGEPFASQQVLQQHLHATGHIRGHARNNPCPADGCNREFARGMNLKAHIRTCHKELARQLDEDGWPARLDAASFQAAVAEAAAVAGDERQLGHQEVLLETQTVEQGDGGEMTWVTTGDQVVQLAHGDAFPADATLVTVDASGTEAEALSNMATTIATSLGIPMGTATTVTTTEDGITVAYLTTSDEHGQQYITVSGDAVDGETVALVHDTDEMEVAMSQQPEEAEGLDESKTIIEN